MTELEADRKWHPIVPEPRLMLLYWFIPAIWEGLFWKPPPGQVCPTPLSGPRVASSRGWFMKQGNQHHPNARTWWLLYLFAKPALFTMPYHKWKTKWDEVMNYHWFYDWGGRRWRREIIPFYSTPLGWIYSLVKCWCGEITKGNGGIRPKGHQLKHR